MPFALHRSDHGPRCLSLAVSATVFMATDVAIFDLSVPRKLVLMPKICSRSVATLPWSVSLSSTKLNTPVLSDVAACTMAPHTSATCTVCSFWSLSHRNVIFSESSVVYVAPHTRRGIMPVLSPGPYTMALRSTTTLRPSTPSTASSAAFFAAASFVHGFTLASSFDAFLPESYTWPVDNSIHFFTSCFAASVELRSAMSTMFSLYTCSA
mmetsp:Transcript_4164/g.6754  ORF Transcript_4164/g.6754 Transcript_4164/m.6754 type:complete len:210 (+) Transcript_4164:214-843(+)